MLITKNTQNTENNTLYTVPKLHLHSLSFEVLLTNSVSSIILVHLAINLSANFFARTI